MNTEPTYTNTGVIVPLKLGAFTSFVFFSRDEAGDYEYKPKQAERASPHGLVNTVLPTEEEMVRAAARILVGKGHAVFTPAWDEMLPN